MRAKNKRDNFLKHLRRYFTVHLTQQRQSSPHTIAASWQTWNMFLEYLVDTQKTQLENLTFENINQDVVYAFLSEKQKLRGWTKATYNQRLSCIRAFYRYAAEAEPLLAMYKQDLSAVHLLKMPKIKPVSYISDEAVKNLLEQPDVSTRTGIRDLFFMVLMFDSAARCGEILGMSFSDFKVKEKSILVIGKGEKPRLIPVTSDTVEHFKRYAAIYHPQSISERPLFYTIRKQNPEPMSHDNVARFMNEYANAAHSICSETPAKVTPHQLRHSRAMGLYRNGMPLALLSEWLGHENPETTLIYAYADTEMKRNAIEKATQNSNIVKPPVTERIWEGNESMIQRLCNMR